MNHPATRPPSRLEWAALLLALLVVLGFGALVELRSAFLSRRMGDLDCYLRPAWAVTAGQSIYDIVEDNGWHYNYPPLYALLLIPLADPPPGHDPTWYVPYSISAAIFYLLNIACLAAAAHLLAGALERHADDGAVRDQPRFCRRWWALRLWPVLVCLPPCAMTAMRGQVNLQILALVCGWIACLLGGRRRLGGGLLAIAACIKVVPVYLLVYPLWRRDGRTLAGCAAGLFVGLIAVPVMVIGPARTAGEYGRYADVFFGPLLQLSDDRSREDELLGMNATDSMGVKHALHSWLYPNPYQRPRAYHPAEEWAHRLLGVLMTLAVLWPLRRGRAAGAWPVVHAVGALLVLMVLFSPVSHIHYFAFCLPLVMSLLFRHWQHRTTLRPSWGLVLAFVGFVAATGLPAVPGLDVLRDRCLPLFGALPLWGIAVVQLWRGQSAPSAAVLAEPRRAA